MRGLVASWVSNHLSRAKPWPQLSSKIVEERVKESKSELPVLYREHHPHSNSPALTGFLLLWFPDEGVSVADLPLTWQSFAFGPHSQQKFRAVFDTPHMPMCIYVCVCV